jgi:intraflagellar transport protein 56
MYTRHSQKKNRFSNHTDCALKRRLLFHLAHRENDEERLTALLPTISDSTEDQLSLASMHYLRAHFQEAAEIYKRLLIEHRSYLALQVCSLL